LTNRTTVAGELDILQAATVTKFHPEMNFIAAGRIIAVHSNSCVSKFAEIPRPPRMIEDDFLVEFFEFRVHEKKRTAACRISIIRSISAVVL